MTEPSPRTLHLNFHGRIIDHLGIQMYQSPVAAVAEMVSNAWDADAERVAITLPNDVGPGAEVVIADDGNGMTFEECQKRFLEVGLNRRKEGLRALTSGKQRPILGRKGIGKFAGFGIASVIEIDTISRETGERTVFSLDVDSLRGDDYVGEGEKDIAVTEYEPPSDDRKDDHGTKITLRRVTMALTPSPSVFRRSMARRFLLHQAVADFTVLVNDDPIPSSENLEGAQFIFPRDYEKVEDRQPKDLEIKDGWGIETLSTGQRFKWRFVFYQDPIQDDELRGIAVFAHGKLAQSPFDFNLVGGLGGQHGLEYLSGRVEADFIDEQQMDFIAPERQRIDWDRQETAPLLEWGRARVKSLLRIWQELRGQAKVDKLTGKIEPFAVRLDKLPKYERRIVEGALRKLAGISRVSDSTFADLAQALLTAWEGGRLKQLISEMDSLESMSADDFMDLLIEAEVMTSLHAAEAVRTKLEVVEGLKQRIQNRELENSLRDYIAKHPWLISPKWETFVKEMSIDNVLREAEVEAKIDREEDWQRRTDLVLSSGDTLIIFEFMRPGLTVDFDHISRFGFYLNAIQTRIEANSAGRFKRVANAYLVADKLGKNTTLLALMKEQESFGRMAMDWKTFIASAEAQWKEFIGILATRAPEDERIQTIATDVLTPPNGSSQLELNTWIRPK